MSRSRRICIYHGGCPDGFGAAFAVWRAWGNEARYVPRSHDQTTLAGELSDAQVVFVDIAPANEELEDVLGVAEHVVVLDHHVSARDRYLADVDLVNRIEDEGHEIVFDLAHSGAVLAWRYFHDEPPPALLRYVEDQDLWSWRLPESQAVNAAIGAHAQRFDVWSDLAARPIEELAREGEPILRANRMEVERRLQSAHPLKVAGRLVEAVNATQGRSLIGHELASRKAYGVAWGCVYRVVGALVHATLYSIGDEDVARIAAGYGGGGHHNAAGFSVPLERWARDFVSV